MTGEKCIGVCVCVCVRKRRGGEEGGRGRGKRGRGKRGKGKRGKGREKKRHISIVNTLLTHNRVSLNQVLKCQTFLLKWSRSAST